MRHPLWLCVLLALSACASGSSQSATLVLRNPFWERVNVEAVITKSGDCSNRGPGYVKTEKFVMSKDETHEVEAAHAENICWRHDRNPNKPQKGVWSGWSRATMFPGQRVETDL